MPNDITTTLSLNKFFNESVDDLEEDHYVVHGNECDICGCDKKADPSDIVNQASSVSSRAIVQTRICPSPHVFHKLCLYMWLSTKLLKDEDATCPMCRTKFILSEHSKDLHAYMQQLVSLLVRFNTVVEESSLQVIRIAEKVKEAMQEEADHSADDAEKLELSERRMALILMHSSAVANNKSARQDADKCSGAVRRVAARIAMRD
ncbi:hypothetical protein ACET3X_001394 [Alternaria dauci]|uniref:Anaphase-promoting complex subunit 11 n=1 Tax=Alternaria dauci TaxID=48095 RepID=A0ABR3UX77_9PLEO